MIMICNYLHEFNLLHCTMDGGLVWVFYSHLLNLPILPVSTQHLVLPVMRNHIILISILIKGQGGQWGVYPWGNAPP